MKESRVWWIEKHRVVIEKRRGEKTKESEDPWLKTEPLIYPVNPPDSSDTSYDVRKQIRRYYEAEKKKKDSEAKRNEWIQGMNPVQEMKPPGPKFCARALPIPLHPPQHLRYPP